MVQAQLPKGHPIVKPKKTAVLLINLGSPEAPDYWSVRRYLKEFLSDPRVIEFPRFLWFLILNLFVLSFRPRKTAHAYKSVWRKDSNESPLIYFTRRQAEDLQRKHPQLIVDWAMRYAKPSIEEKLLSLRAAGAERILLFALYPQYSATTSASVYDECFRVLSKMRWQPAIRTMATYHDDPRYISAVSESVQEHLTNLGWKPEKILISFHGLPKKYLLRGDPYHCYCQKSGRLIRENLGWSKENCVLSFQSRFGPEEWLQPYTDETLISWAQSGVKKVLMLSPGFVSDCLETLEELQMQNKELFHEHGGTHFSYVPCLNDSERGVGLLSQLVEENLQGWILKDS